MTTLTTLTTQKHDLFCDNSFSLQLELGTYSWAVWDFGGILLDFSMATSEKQTQSGQSMVIISPSSFHFFCLRKEEDEEYAPRRRLQRALNEVRLQSAILNGWQRCTLPVRFLRVSAVAQLIMRGYTSTDKLLIAPIGWVLPEFLAPWRWCCFWWVEESRWMGSEKDCLLLQGKTNAAHETAGQKKNIVS